MTAKPRNQTRSIGEVLALLKNDFDDITISKIRFLEGQGLIEPERTASGYRKFSEHDIARLRYILRQQKDHFLPLKVIKGRLGDPEADGVVSLVDETNTDGEAVAAGAMLDRAALLELSGLNESQLRELERFAMVQVQKSGNSSWYDENALTIAKLAQRYLSFGVEVRHLRIFKTAADREADLYRQLTPVARGHRNTQARMDAEARLGELSDLGESMRAELLRQSLSDS